MVKKTVTEGKIKICLIETAGDRCLISIEEDQDEPIYLYDKEAVFVAHAILALLKPTSNPPVDTL